MLRKPFFAVAFVTGYLFLYYILFEAGAPAGLIMCMFLFSPVLMAWMVITVLKYGQYKGRRLPEEEEWGYEDKKREDLGTF